MTFKLSHAKIEESLLSKYWPKATTDWINSKFEDEDGSGVIQDEEVLDIAVSLETLADDLREIVATAQKERKIYEWLRRNNLDFAEFEEMAHLLLD